MLLLCLARTDCNMLVYTWCFSIGKTLFSLSFSSVFLSKKEIFVGGVVLKLE